LVDLKLRGHAQESLGYEFAFGCFVCESVAFRLVVRSYSARQRSGHVHDEAKLKIKVSSKLTFQFRIVRKHK